MKLETEHMTAPCAGYRRNGDAVLVRASGEAALLAVIDGLGHGPAAADVADRAVSHLEAAPLDDVIAIMEGLHEALRGSRGAAAMVSLLRDGRLEGCGVGNVDLRSLRSAVPVVQSPGILGVRVRRYHRFFAEIRAGARLVLFSDGISARAPIGDTERMGPREACEFLFRGFRRSHDDATVLVADVKEYDAE